MPLEVIASMVKLYHAVFKEVLSQLQRETCRSVVEIPSLGKESGETR